MDTFLDFARGPLFRLTFALMLLGLARILIMDIAGMIGAYRKAGDKNLPWGLIILRTFEWLVPVKRIGHNRPIYSVLAILFHIGLILTPIFLFAHVQLWRSGIGFGWWTLSPNVADYFTLLTIGAGLAIFLGRVGSGAARGISRKQDVLWPIVLLVPFVTGYLCSNVTLAAGTYKTLMLLHVLSAETIFLLIPFTKIAHCVLMPFSQLVGTLAWKFPARVDDDICETLHKKGAPV